MKSDERKSLLRQGVHHVQTPRERRQVEELTEDVKTSPLRGAPALLRLRNFTPRADAYLRSLGGPLPYMQRLREIERLTAEHEQSLERTVAAIRDERLDDASVGRRVADLATALGFDEVNELIARHNRWYPVEAGLPMDPRRGDYALVNGLDYRRQPLGEHWVEQRVRERLRTQKCTESVSPSSGSPD